MKHSFFRISLLLFLTSFTIFQKDALASTKRDTISIESLGLKPDSRENAVPYVKKAIDMCLNKTNPVLVFPKGRYDFWPQHCIERDYFESNTTDNNPKRLAIFIERMEEFTLDGLGSIFIFHDRMQPFTVDNSQSITIQNVSIDWDIPLTAQARVSNVTPDYIELNINAYESPYIIENNKLVFIGEGWKSPWSSTIEFDAETETISPQSGDQCLGKDWQKYRAEEIKTGVVRVYYPFKRKPEINNWLVLRHSARDHAGIFIVDSKNVHLNNINMYHCAGLGVLSQFSENLYFSKVNCVPNKSKGRILAGHDDGLHFSNCKGQIDINDCKFHALMDDPINVHGTAVKIVEKVSSKKLRCKFMHSQSVGLNWARKGDLIGLLNHNTMHTVGKIKVTTFKKIDAETIEIEFEETIPSTIMLGDALENITWSPDVAINNCFFGSCRARGILVSTPGKVLIENNIFESSGSAILIAGDANYWYETGAVKDVLIKDNIFRSYCLTSMYQFCEAVISICPEIPTADLDLPYHRNIIMTNNEFDLFDYPIVYAFSVQGLEFSNNTLKRSFKFKPWHVRKAGLTFDSCSQIKIYNNKTIGDILGVNIALFKTSKEELKTPIDPIFHSVEIVR